MDEVDIGTAWEGLVSKPRSQLVDVRTRAEWTYVGIPDLGPLGKRAVLVEWQTFPDQAVDARFAERLAGELKALGVQSDDDLYLHLPFGEPEHGCGQGDGVGGLPQLSQRRMRLRRTARRRETSRHRRRLEGGGPSLAARLGKHGSP